MLNSFCKTGPVLFAHADSKGIIGCIFAIAGQKFKMSETRVLVIDDNIDLTTIVSLILGAEGFLVKVCNTVEEGLFYLKDWKPNLLLLDVNVDGEDTRVLCKTIKAGSQQPITIILMSGDESTLDDDDSYGANDHISKPFDSAELLQKISAHLAHKVST